MPIWQLCANLLIPNCLRSNLSCSPLAALEPYVNLESTKFFCPYPTIMVTFLQFVNPKTGAPMPIGITTDENEVFNTQG